jgi:hypothetical protein
MAQLLPNGWMRTFVGGPLMMISEQGLHMGSGACARVLLYRGRWTIRVVVLDGAASSSQSRAAQCFWRLQKPTLKHYEHIAACVLASC